MDGGLDLKSNGVNYCRGFEQRDEKSDSLNSSPFSKD